MAKPTDLTGRTFGRLTVKERGPNDRHGNARWWCSCSCGKPHWVLTGGACLRKGETRSCGCRQKEAWAANRCSPDRRVVDMTGRTFGRLTVEERGPSSPYGGARWWCSCSCGNPERVLVRGGSLRQGLTNSCKCLQRERQAGFDGLTSGAAKAVRNPDGTVYRSLKDASLRFGMPPGDIARWCRDGDYGWSFLPDD